MAPQLPVYLEDEQPVQADSNAPQTSSMQNTPGQSARTSPFAAATHAQRTLNSLSSLAARVEEAIAASERLLTNTNGPPPSASALASARISAFLSGGRADRAPSSAGQVGEQASSMGAQRERVQQLLDRHRTARTRTTVPANGAWASAGAATQIPTSRPASSLTDALNAQGTTQPPPIRRPGGGRAEGTLTITSSPTASAFRTFSGSVGAVPATEGTSAAAAMRNQFRNKVVVEVCCRHCQITVCRRGMRAILLADTTVELYSTDAPPCRVSLVADDYTTANCACRIRDIACNGCGNVVGYHVTQPCDACLDSCNNGHFFMFHMTEITSVDRVDAGGGGKCMRWAHLPHADADVEPGLVGADGCCR